MSGPGNPALSESTIPRRKGVPWRRDPVVRARLPQVQRLHFSGKSNREIARALGVDEQTIRADIPRLNELWLEEISGEDAKVLRAKAAAELTDIKHRALEAAAFDEACERAVLFDEAPPWQTSPGEGGDKYPPDEDADEFDEAPPEERPAATVGVVRRDDRGSAQFRGNKAAALGQARQAVMDRAKVLGLVVEKQALTNAAGQDLSIDELSARYAAAHPAAEPSQRAEPSETTTEVP